MDKDSKIGIDKARPKIKVFILGEDYYINEQGNWVFTSEYHLKRGYCCNNNCRHCPYLFQ